MGSVRKVPMRKCTGCGEMKSKREMLRVLRTTEDHSGCDGQKERERRISVREHGVLSEGGKVQRTGAVPEDCDSCRSL